MNIFVEKIKELRGPLNFVDFADKTGVNRQSLANAESGELLRISSLEKIAKACRLTDAQWAELLVAWVFAALGDHASFVKVHPVSTDGATAKSPERKVELPGLLTELFTSVTRTEQCQILKALARPTVRNALGPLNEIHERGRELDHLSPGPTRQDAFLQSVEVLAQNWDQAVQVDQNNFLVTCSKCQPAPKEKSSAGNSKRAKRK